MKEITIQEIKRELKKYPHTYMDFIISFAVKKYPYSILNLIKKNHKNILK